MKGLFNMDEYKWYKDDFENNVNNNAQNNDFYTNADNSENENSGFETNYSEGASQSGFGAEEQTEYSDSAYTASESEANTGSDGYTFYNTNVRSKKSKKKKVSVLSAAIAVVLTAALSVSGAVIIPRALNSSKVAKNSSPASGSNTVGAAIVASSAADTADKKALSTPEIVDKVGPAVVGIINKATLSNYGNYFGGIFGNQQQEQEVEQSSGSGVVISQDGYIVTNNHVVEGAQELVVILNTGDEYTAKLIGTDSKTDLAVLKIEASGLTYATLGNSSELRVGDTAIAIGNPLGQEFAGTTTQGIISGLNRTVTVDNKQLTLIQTDAAINPGNSGGALVNAYGELIGINTAKISSSSLEGLGFAIPIDEVKPIISELIDNGYVTGRPVIGIGGRAVTEQDAAAYNLKVGVYVSSMTADSPAYMAGVKIGDIIVECNGKEIETVDDINKIKNQFSPGDKLKIKVYRQGEYKDITLVLGEEVPSK